MRSTFSPRSLSDSTKGSQASFSSSSKTAAVSADLPQLIITGYTLVPDPSTIGPTITVQVLPKERVGDVHLKVTGINPISIADVSVDTINGTITFQVKGTSPTPANAPDKSDTRLHTTDGVDGPVLSTAKVRVVIPWAIPYPESTPLFDADVEIRRTWIDNGTVPPYGPKLPQGMVYLVDLSVKDFAIVVNDQFGDVLDSIYAGTKVETKSQSEEQWVDAIVKMQADGTYIDIIGYFQPKPDPNPVYRYIPGVYPLEETENFRDWMQRIPSLPPPDHYELQEEGVKIGGHILNTGIVDRAVYVTPGSTSGIAHLLIVWPET